MGQKSRGQLEQRGEAETKGRSRKVGRVELGNCLWDSDLGLALGAIPAL